MTDQILGQPRDKVFIYYLWPAQAMPPTLEAHNVNSVLPRDSQRTVSSSFLTLPLYELHILLLSPVSSAVFWQVEKAWHLCIKICIIEFAPPTYSLSMPGSLDG